MRVLNNLLLAQTKVSGFCNNDMIEKFDAQQLSGIGKAPGKRLHAPITILCSRSEDVASSTKCRSRCFLKAWLWLTGGAPPTLVMKFASPRHNPIDIRFKSLAQAQNYFHGWRPLPSFDFR